MPSLPGKHGSGELSPGSIVDIAGNGFYALPRSGISRCISSEEQDVYRKASALLLSVTLMFAGTATRVSAAVISTQDARATETRESRLAGIGARLARDDVRAAMVELGVDPRQAELRVAALSDQELAQLDTRLDSLPAGEGALALVGAVFLVLMILEFTGVIDIFKKI